MQIANIILRKHDYLIFDASFIKSYIFATPAFYRQIKLACFIKSILNKNLIWLILQIMLIFIPYPWQAYRTKTFSRIHFVLKFQQFQAYNNLMVHNTVCKKISIPYYVVGIPTRVWQVSRFGSFSVIYRLYSTVNRPKEHRKIYFVVSSVHSYSIKCFDVYLQIDIADKENIAFSGCQTFQTLCWNIQHIISHVNYIIYHIL